MNTARQHTFAGRQSLEPIRACPVIPLTELRPAEVCF